MILRKLNYWIESRRIHDSLYWKLLVLIKDVIYAPVHYLCLLKPFRFFFFKYFGTTGKYEPRNRAIISHKYKFVYFYIPKVASTSLKKCFAKILFDKDVSVRVHTFWFDEVIDIQTGDYEDYFKFTFVRNPWDRIVSCYSDKILHTPVTNYKYKKGIFRRYVRLYKTLFYSGMSFNEFTRKVSMIPDEKADRHFRSQHTYINDKNGQTLVNFIGKFENLSADLKYVSEKTGAKNLDLGHENKSIRPKEYRDIYTDEAKKIIAERYKKDIALFGYQFPSY